MSQIAIRDRFVKTLDHVNRICCKLSPVTGNGKVFTFPESWKISEGLFLTSWTHWEQFVQQLFVADLASSRKGQLHRRVREFRTKRANAHLAQLIVGHPDTKRWIEWSDYNDVISRAGLLLGDGNRFSVTNINGNDLFMLKRIRNAIAHKSDRAWTSFLKLAKNEPFSLTAKQMKGITVGRFLIAHDWNAQSVLKESIRLLKTNAHMLVP